MVPTKVIINTKTKLIDKSSAYPVQVFSSKKGESTIVSRKFCLREASCKYDVETKEEEQLWNRVFGMAGKPLIGANSKSIFYINVLFRPLFNSRGEATSLVSLKVSWKGLNGQVKHETLGTIGYDKFYNVSVSLLGGQMYLELKNKEGAIIEHKSPHAAVPKSCYGAVLPPILNPELNIKGGDHFTIFIKQGDKPNRGVTLYDRVGSRLN